MKPRQPAAGQSVVPGANSSPDSGKLFLAGHREKMRRACLMDTSSRNEKGHFFAPKLKILCKNMPVS
jgi:hypothetical protein